ncbi:MAG TPA: Ig-like domain repeat protein [Terriglobales bacterium]
MQSGSDPSLATTPGGHFYLGALFFTPGHLSNVAVVQYRDLPDTDGGDAIRYQGVAIIDRGSQSDSGNFIDKPSIAADIARGTNSATVCGPVYIAYTIFTGGGGSIPFTSKVGVAHSNQGNCGSTWSKPQYLNKNFKQNQGTAIAIDPKTGKVYVFWRHVFQPGGDGFPDGILMVTSTDGGNTFSNPVAITPSSYAPFDQPGLTTTSYGNNPAFRSNSFPTVAIDGNGTLYVASQEKTSPTGSGYPSGYYEPRIVLRTSKNGGGAWTAGSIVDQGGGASYAQQFMPALSFGGGLLKLMWYDFRDQNQASLNIAGGWYVAGLDRQMKTYVAQSSLSRLDAYGNPVFSPSVPVSQYLIEVNTGQVATVGGVPGGYPAVNRPNLPMYSAGTTPFTGDYNWQATASPYVPNFGGSTAFRWATKPTDYIAMPTFGVWTDSRDVVFPTFNYGVPTLNDLLGWQQYAPPGTGLSCINAGARNANLYVSEIRPGVIAASPATSRQLVDVNNKPMERAFPLYIQNPNSDAPNQTPPGKFFRVSFNNLGSPISGSFSQGTELTGPIASVDLNILQYSSATVTLYVYCSGCSSSLPFAPFNATVQQIDSFGGSVISGGATTTIFFDSDPTAPFVTNPNLSTQENHNANVSNPQYTNPQYTNPQYTNPQYTNPQYTNPQYTNPQYTNVTPSDSLSAGTLPVGEFVWTITDVGNNASGYTAVANIAQSNLTNLYVYEAIIARTYNFPGFNSCNSQPIPQDAIVSIIPNPQYTNPQYTNPQYTNPQYTNPQYTNATFAAVPPPPGSTSSPTAAPATSTSTDDGTTKMPVQTDHVYYVLRVYRADGSSNVLSATEQSQILANTSLIVFPQAPNTGQGTPTQQPPAQGSSNKTFTTTMLTSSAPASVFGQPVTLTATVSPSTGSGVPGGSVDFRDGSTLLQTVPMVNGAAVLNTSSLAVGSQTIKAIYSGDQNFVGSVSNSITQQIASVLTVTTTSLPSAIVGVNYGPQQVSATGGTTPYCWSNAPNTCPINPVAMGNGFLISNTGQITGVPQHMGSTQLTAYVSDSGPPVQTASGLITVQVSGPLITTESLVNGVVSSAYPTSDFMATGGVGTLTWSIASGFLPANMSLSPSGTLSGTPGTSGTFNFTVQVTDQNGNTGSQALTLLISPATGDLIVADGVPSAPTTQIVRINPYGTNSNVIATIDGDADAVAVDASSGNIYVADPRNARIIKVSRFGSQSIFFSGLPLQSPVALAVDSSGNVYAADNGAIAVFKFTAAGTSLGSFAKLPNNTPGADVKMVFDSNGNLAVASDNVNNMNGEVQIDLVSPSAQVTTLYNTASNAFTTGAITSVGGLAIAPSGDYFVADWSASQVLDLSNPGKPNMNVIVQAGDISALGMVLLPTNSNTALDLVAGAQLLQVTLPGPSITTLIAGAPLTSANDVAQYGTPASPNWTVTIDASGSSVSTTGVEALASNLQSGDIYAESHTDPGGTSAQLAVMRPNRMAAILGTSTMANSDGSGIAVDTLNGFVIVTDEPGQRIALVEPNSAYFNVSTLFNVPWVMNPHGNGTGQQQYAVAQTPSGTVLYFWDNTNAGLYKLSPVNNSGTLTGPIVSLDTSTTAGLHFATTGNHVIFDPNTGTVLLSDSSSGSIFEINPATASSTTLFSGLPTGLGLSLALKSDSNQLFVQEGNSIFVGPRTGGTLSLVASGFLQLTNIILTPNHNIWFTEFSGNKIGKLNLSGSNPLYAVDKKANVIYEIVETGSSNTPGLTEFSIPTGFSDSTGITAGPDGNVWFLESNGNNTARITSAGTISEFPVPTSNSGLGSIALGPDGNLWFTENVGKIGTFSTGTPNTINEYSGPGLSEEDAITAGPEGNIWFTASCGFLHGCVANVPPSGSPVTSYTAPNQNTAGQGIATGPDGNVWFTEVQGDKIGVITPGGTITEYPIPTTGGDPGAITPGPDGNLWFTEPNVNQIARITPTGTVTEFPIPTPFSNPTGITVGPDGNVWFTEQSGNKIGMITTNGPNTITEFALPAAASFPSGITAGP